MSILEELQLKSFINAAGTYTDIGGSRMSEQTLNSIKEISRTFVDIRELQDTAQNKIADLTKNEAACICNGAAAGLYLCAVSTVSKKYNKPAKYLTMAEITKSEILSLNAQHIPYDFSVYQLGVKHCFVGYPNITGSSHINDLAYRISSDTCALFYFISSPYGLHTPGTIPLQDVIELGKKHDIPVIVDAAAQLPPVDNLWKFTQQGADAVLFSGGKDLRGPQSSGLIVGKKEFLHIVQQINFPNYGFGRILKTGREEIIGLYEAVKQYVALDHKKRADLVEQQIVRCLDVFKNSNLYVMERVYPNEAGQDLAYIKVILKDSNITLTLKKFLLDSQPAVFIKLEANSFYINPMTLEEYEMNIIISKLKDFETMAK